MFFCLKIINAPHHLMTSTDGKNVAFIVIDVHCRFVSFCHHATTCHHFLLGRLYYKLRRLVVFVFIDVFIHIDLESNSLVKEDPMKNKKLKYNNLVASLSFFVGDWICSKVQQRWLGLQHNWLLQQWLLDLELGGHWGSRRWQNGTWELKTWH